MHPAQRQRDELWIPSTGITLLEGPGYFGKDVRHVVQHWTAILLSQGHAVHWIDGGHRFDPSGFFPAMRSLNCPIEDGLRRLYIGRGFTLHQLHALISRVQHEVALTHASMIVIDGMLKMFLDEQIKRFESRSILRHCMDSLEKLSLRCPIVLLDGKSKSPLHQQLKHTMRPYLNQRLKGEWDGQRKTPLRFTNTAHDASILIERPKTPIEQHQLTDFTSIDPGEQTMVGGVHLQTNRTELKSTILHARPGGDNDQHQCAELDVPFVHIPEQERRGARG